MANENIYLGRGPKDPDLKRSKYDFSFTNHLTAKFGLIYPHFLMDCNAGESVSIKDNAEFDLMPMYFPLQSRINMHISYFKCAFRNLWKSYKDVVSRVGNHVWPYVSQTYNWHKTGSLADYMNIPSYSSVPVYTWDTKSGITSSDDSVTELARSYRSVDLDHPYSSVSGLPFAVQHYDSLNHMFMKQSRNDEPCALVSDLFTSRVAVSQPYLMFRVVTATSTVPSIPNLGLGLFTYCNDRNIVRPLSTKSPSLYFSWDDNTYAISSSLAADYASVLEGTGALVHSVSKTAAGGVGIYVHTFLIHLRKQAFNQWNAMVDAFGNVRLYLSYPNTDDNKLALGYTFIPKSLPYESSVSSAIGSVAFSSTSSYSNGHYALTNNSYQLAMAGLQLYFSVRTETSINKSGDNSPFMVVDGEVQKPLSVLPFRMYQFIYNLYFRNSQVDPFIKNGQPTYNEYLTNDGDGADSTTPLEFNHCLWEKDIFTTAKFTPQAGNAPLVGISHTPGASSAEFHFVDENDQPVVLRVDTSSNGTLTGISEYSTNANESTLNNLNALIQYGISINDFRSVSAFQRFLERYQTANFDYKSLIKEFFGTNAPIGEEFPEYIGGFTRPVNIYKLENQSVTDMPLGMFAGTGRVSGNSKHPIKCFCSEQSYIMGLLWFSVTPVYPQSLPKHWTKSQLLDWYNPQFATIGNQPIYNYEVAPLQATDSEELNGVFGYQRPWYEYTMRFDEVHGQFRDSQHNYLIQREFANVPQLGKQFIEIENDDLTNVFSYQEGTDKIFGAIRHDVVYNSVVPKFITPKIVG